MRRFAWLLPLFLATPALACPPAPGQFAPNCVNNGDSVDGFSQFFLTDLSNPVPPGGTGQAGVPIFLFTLPPSPPDTGIALGNFSNLWLPPVNSTAGPPSHQIAPGVAGRPPGEVRAGDPVRDNRTGEVIGTVVNISIRPNDALPDGTVLDNAGASGGIAVRRPDGSMTVVTHYGVGPATAAGAAPPSLPTLTVVPPGVPAIAPAPPPTTITRANGTTVVIAPPPPVVPAVPPGTRVGVVLSSNSPPLVPEPSASSGTPVGEGTLLVSAGATSTQVPVTIVRRPDGSLVAVDAQGVVRGTAEERKAGPFGLTYKVTPLPGQPASVPASPAPATQRPSAPNVLPGTPEQVRAEVFGAHAAGAVTMRQTYQDAKKGGHSVQVSVTEPPSLYNFRTGAGADRGVAAWEGAKLIREGARAQLVAAVRDGRVPGRVDADGSGATISADGLDAAKPYLDLIDAADAEVRHLEASFEQQPRDNKPAAPLGSADPPVQGQDRQYVIEQDDLFLSEGESVL